MVMSGSRPLVGAAFLCAGVGAFAGRYASGTGEISFQPLLSTLCLNNIQWLQSVDKGGRSALQGRSPPYPCAPPRSAPAPSRRIPSGG